MILVHNNKKVLALVGGKTQVSTLQVVFNGTQAECDAEIARLQLIPLPPPPIRPLPTKPKPPINEPLPPN